MTLVVTALWALQFALPLPTQAPPQPAVGPLVVLPQASNAPTAPGADRPDAGTLTVTRSGAMFLGTTPLTRAALGASLRSALAGGERELYVKADTLTPANAYITPLRAAGFSSFTLLVAPAATEPPDDAAPPGPSHGIPLSILPLARGSLSRPEFSFLNPILIDVKQGGVYSWLPQDGRFLRGPNSLAGLHDMLQQEHRDRSGAALVLRGDPKLATSEWVRVFDTALGVSPAFRMGLLEVGIAYGVPAAN